MKMTNKIWINRIHSAEKRADLSLSISSSAPNRDIVINSGQRVEVDLKGNPGSTEISISSGDIVYIAANGVYKFDGKEQSSLRIVAKGVVQRVYDRNGVPVAVFMKNSFEYLTAPMINGFDLKRFYENLPVAPFWEINVDRANYIDENIFSGSGVKHI
jgi:hypothetical protein